MNILPKESLEKKIITRGIWLYIFPFFIVPLGYVSRAIVTNSLSVEDVGMVYAVIGLITLLVGYNDLGLTGALKYFLPKYRTEGKIDSIVTLVSVSYILQMITGLLLSSFFFFSADWLATNYFHYSQGGSIIKIFALYFLFFNVFQIIKGTSAAFQDTFFQKSIEFIQSFVTAGATVLVFIYLPHSPENFSRTRNIGLFVSILIGSYRYFRKYSMLFKEGKIVFKKDELSKVFSFSFALFLTINISMLLGQTDLQMITYMMGATYAGYFTSYTILAYTTNILLIPLSTFIFPVVSELYARKDISEVENLLSICYKYLPISVFSLGFFFIALGPEIATALLGSKFIYSGFLLQLGGGFLFLKAIVSINFSILAGIGRINKRLKIIIFAFLVNIVLNYIGIAYYNIPGAIIATVTTWMFICVYSIKELNKVITIKLPTTLFLKNSIFIVPICLLILLSKGILFEIAPAGRYWSLLVIILLFSVYCIALLLRNREIIIPLYTTILRIIKDK